MNFKINKNIFSLKSLILLFVFLATLNTVNRYYYFIFVAFGLFLLCNNRKIVFNMSLLALFLLSVSMIVFSSSYSYSVLGILKPFTYMMCYILGYGLYDYENTDNNGKKSFYLLSVVVALGPLVHYLLNWIINLSNYDTRNTIDFWTNSVLSATGQASLACIPLALVVSCVFMKTSRKIKIISIVTILAILGYNLILSGRTLLVLLLVVGVVAFIHMLKNQRTKRMHYIFVFVAVLLLLVIVYNLNLFGVKSMVESSLLYDRFYGDYASGIEDDNRWGRKLLYLENMTDSFFGGLNLHDKFGYAHDIFLDTYDESGIFALLAVIIYIVASIHRMIKCVSNELFPFELRQIILCVYLAIYLQFMTEPILQGMPWLFASFCLIDGSLSRIIAYKKRASGPIMR